jgi:polyisoprenoid-binding protein YceI
MSQTWNIDPSHTSLEFAVRHMMISTVRGSFKVSGGGVELDDQGKLLGVEATIETASVNTKDTQRDGHLNSPDFFDSANHPNITFKSTNVQANGDNNYKVEGHLTIRGETKPVTLEVETSQTQKDPWGNTKIAANGTTKISRKEWGLVWNAALESGGVLVADEVKITLDVQAAAPSA